MTLDLEIVEVRFDSLDSGEQLLLFNLPKVIVMDFGTGREIEGFHHWRWI
jgi:hypothetical protein